MTSARLRLDDQLCFALYAATNAITRAYRPLLRELGITYPQYLTLMALWQHGDGAVSELARHLDLPAHALTPLLRRLEQAGLVQRRRSPLDSRVVLVELTPDGARLETSAAAVQRTVECSTGLSPHALAALRGELHHLADDLRTTTASSHPMEGRAS
ncbi:MAG: MarR family transcriptional regulator [Mycobacteriales bacterium]